MPITITIKAFLIKFLREMGQPITAGTLEVAKEWMQDCITDISNRSEEIDFSKVITTLTTVIGTSQYTLAYKQIRGIAVQSTGQNLNHVNKDWITSRGFKLSQTGSSLVYLDAGFTPGSGLIIQLWPVPTSIKIYDVFASLDHSALNLSDTFPLPQAWSVIIKTYLKYMLFEQAPFEQAEEAITNSSKALNFFGIYEKKADELIKRLEYGSGDSFRMEYTDLPTTSSFPPGPRWPDNYPG